jgi:hypothetical protein
MNTKGTSLEKKSVVLERVSALYKPAVIAATVSAPSIACDRNLSSAAADPYEIMSDERLE